MKPYGIPRINNAANCDVADGQGYGRKASVVNLPGKGGNIRSNFKNPKKKQAVRRYWARAARAIGVAEIKNQLNYV